MAAPPPPGAGGPMPFPMGMGRGITPEQAAAMKRQFEAEAERLGMTPQEFADHLRKQAQQRMMAAAAQQQQQQQGGDSQGGPGGGPGAPHNHQHPPGPHSHGPRPGGPQPQPITPGPPNPKALALANFLKSQDLKCRTCILNDQRKDMFKVKRALRAIQSPAYEKARKKNPLLPEVKDRASLENTFKLLPMSMLALRVSKIDPHEGHSHGPSKKTKRTKGLWTVKIERQQDAEDDMYYAWMYEGAQIKRQLYAVLALIVIFILVLYPLWPLKLRQGVYYLSWGFLVLLGLFFLMAIFRVILFCITYFVVSPGLWLYPNLWEDVSFMDSFRPVWAWHDPNPKKKKKKKAGAASGIGNVEAQSQLNAATGNVTPATATTTATDTQVNIQPKQRSGYVAPQVEEDSE